MKYLSLALMFFSISIIGKAQSSITIYPDIDAVVKSCNSTTNYGNDTNIVGKYVASPVCTIRTFIKFNLSSIPSNAVINYARLTFYGLHHTGTANSSYLQRVTATWAENTVTWSNQPATTTTNQLFLANSTSSTQNYIIDVTDFVSQWCGADSSLANYGLMLKLKTESGANSLEFASSDFTRLGGKVPKLEISYTLLSEITLYPDEDAMISSNNSTTNYGTYSSFISKHTSSPDSTFRSLIKFNLDSIPSQARIQAATFTLYGLNHSGTNSSSMQRITSTWTETGVNWSNQPAKTSTGQILLSNSASSTQDYSLNVKDFIQGWKNNSFSNYGLMLLLQNETTVGKLVFASSDYGQSTKKPKLVIKYYIPVSYIDTLIPNKDAHLGYSAQYSAWANTNYGTSQYFIAETWTSGGYLYKFRGICELNLSTIPDYSTIRKAEYHHNWYDTTATWLQHSGSNQSYFHKVTKSWTESLVTWNIADTSYDSNEKIEVSTSTSATQSWVIEIAPFVQKWINKEWNNYGFLFRLATEGTYRRIACGSSDRYKVSARPFCIVTYVPPITLTGTVTNSIDSTLGAISLAVTGGIPPYTYSWSNGDTTSSINNLWLGKYTVTVTDFLNKTQTTSYYVLRNIEWTELVKTESRDDSIIKTYNSSAWDAGGVSRNILKANEEGYIYYKVNENNYSSVSKMLGFNKVNKAQMDSIYYVFKFNSSGTYSYSINGSIGKSTSYTMGDEFKIMRSGGYIYFYKNAVQLYSVSTNMSDELIADVGLYHQNAYFKDVKVSFGCMPVLSINTYLLDTSYNYTIVGQGLDSTNAVGNKKDFWLNRILPSDTVTFVLTFKNKIDPSDTLHLEFEMNNDYQIDNFIGKIDSSGFTQTILLDSSFFTIENGYDLTFFNGDTTINSFDSIAVSLILDRGLVMSPDNDGHYDSLKVSGMLDKINIYSLTVKDLSDNTMFTTTNKTESWDGKIGGSLVAKGVYKYILVADENTLNGQFIIEY